MSHADPEVTAPPASAYQFKAQRPTLSAVDAQGRRKFEAIFYSGDVIKDHWYWGNLVFDIGTSKAKPRVGVLLQHKPEQIVGSGEVIFGDDMRVAGLLSAKTDFAKFVADQADEGFPWEMSHYIEPGEISQVKAGEKVTVNNRQFVGPLTIFRNNEIREVSFCANGADSQTSATVFNKAPPGAIAMEPNKTTPTIEELQASVTKLSATVETLTTANATQAKEIATYRTAQVEALFTARGEKFADDAAKAAAAKPWLEMSADSFVTAMKFAAPKAGTQAQHQQQQRNPALFAAEHVVGDGEGEGGTRKSGLVEKSKKMAARAA